MVDIQERLRNTEDEILFMKQELEQAISKLIVDLARQRKELVESMDHPLVPGVNPQGIVKGRGCDIDNLCGRLFVVKTYRRMLAMAKKGGNER